MAMTMREIAEELIEAVEGIPNTKHIEGVLKVFEGIKAGCDNVWEDYIYNNINDVLLMSNAACPCCKAAIRVTRDRKRVAVHVDSGDSLT